MDAELTRNGHYQKLHSLLMDAAESTQLRKVKVLADPSRIDAAKLHYSPEVTAKKLQEMVQAEQL